MPAMLRSVVLLILVAHAVSLESKLKISESKHHPAPMSRNRATLPHSRSGLASQQMAQKASESCAIITSQNARSVSGGLNSLVSASQTPWMTWKPEEIEKSNHTTPSLVRERSKQDPKTQKKFEEIYETSVWGLNKFASRSGPGSLDKPTMALCTQLYGAVMQVLADKGLKGKQEVRILDAPSGDWYWMPKCLSRVQEVLPDEVSLNYQGVDIAQFAVDASNTKRQSHEFSIKRTRIAQFHQMDLADPGVLANKFGAKAFDIVLSHDALQHNDHSNIRKILKNFEMVGEYLLVDLDRAGQNQHDIKTGEYRPVDITVAPYGFKPLCMDQNVNQLDSEQEWFGLFKLPLSGMVH